MQQYITTQQPQNQLIQTPFGIMVPGQLAVTQFEQLGPYLTYPLLNPGTIHSVGFFLFQPINQDMGACLYFSIPPYQGLEFIGAVANARPSDIFPTNFALNPNVNTLQELKLIVQIQPLDEQLQSLVNLTKQSENQAKYAMAIAQNLHNYMCSFNQEIVVNGQQQEMIVTPINVLDKWIKRFQEKYLIDPNFIYKTTN